MKNKKRILSLRTKAEAILVASFLICLSVISVMSVTRTITDSSDTVYTYITNSNGNFYEATAANIPIALENVNTTNDNGDEDGGWVLLPNATFLVDNTVHVPINVSLYMGGATFVPTADIRVVQPHAGSEIHNGIIDLEPYIQAGNDFTKSCIYVNTTFSDFSGNRLISILTSRLKITDMTLNSTRNGYTTYGYGIRYHCPKMYDLGYTTSNVVCAISGSYVDSITTRYFNRAIFINNSHAGDSSSGVGGGEINGNFFSRIYDRGSKYVVYIDNRLKEGTDEQDDTITASQTSTEGNHFIGIDAQARFGAVNAIYCEGWANQFENINIFDWATYGNSSYALNFTNVSRYNRVLGGNGCTPSRIYNDASSTQNSFQSYSNLNINSITSTDVNSTDFCKSSRTDANFFLNCNNANVLSNNELVVLGYDTGDAAARWLKLGILTDGSAVIKSRTNEHLRLETESGTGYAKVQLQYQANGDVTVFENSGTGENNNFTQYARKEDDSGTYNLNVQGGSDDTFYWNSTQGNYSFNPNGGACNFTDIISLDPLATLPERPHAGMIIFYDGNNTLLCYDGSAWKGFWT